MHSRTLLVAVSFALVMSVPPNAAHGEVVARVGETTIERTELEARVASELAQIEAQRARALEQGLRALVDERLIALEGERRGVSPEEVVAGLETEPVTEDDIQAWYAANKARVRRPLEDVETQVREVVETSRRQEAIRDLLERLSEETAVVWHLEPWRVAIDNSSAPRRGGEGRPVEVTVFSDFECPWCKRLVPSLEGIVSRYREKLAVAFRHFPLTSIHPKAEGAALASICADEQGKFWPFHDQLFGDDGNLDSAGLQTTAADLGLDLAAFDACRGSDSVQDRLAAEVREARSLGVTSTPSVFVNGRPVTLTGGRPVVDQLAEVVDDELRRRGHSG